MDDGGIPRLRKRPWNVRLEHGDCVEVLPRLIEERVRVDSVVTDPPYHLSTAGRFGGENSAPAKFGTDGLYQRASRGFMGKEWDGGGVAFDPETWGLVLRILKPGGYLLAFGGTRTYHRMACAIEDAGFEIRDQIGWLYGSGFPKSHDMSKAIDIAAGVADQRGRIPTTGGLHGGTGNTVGKYASDGTQLSDEPVTREAKRWDGWGTALKPAWEPIVVARKPIHEDTVAANVLRHGTGAINIDACRVETTDDMGEMAASFSGDSNVYGKMDYNEGETWTQHDKGRWPANIIHDGSDEVLAAFAKFGESGGGAATRRARTGGIWSSEGDGGIAQTFGDHGTAARFFYSAKASKEDRHDSAHPTVKPVRLISYLCRLVTPPGGTVLDPFAGSGTLAPACRAEKFCSILIEREAEYMRDIERRCAEANPSVNWNNAAGHAEV